MVKIQYDLMSEDMVEVDRFLRTEKIRPHAGDLIRVEVDGKKTVYEAVKCMLLEFNEQNVDMIVYCKIYGGFK